MRINPFKAAPEVLAALAPLERYARAGGLDERLLQQVETRASQINGCPFCIDLHVKAALDAGEDPQRLHLLAAWRDSPLFDARERAALAWTEAVTRISDGGPGDEVYEAAAASFSDAELVRLTAAVAAINAWNRLAGAFRLPHPQGMAARVGSRPQPRVAPAVQPAD